MISRVRRSKFWRWLARGAPVLALMLVLLGSVLVQTALATDPPDPTGGDASFYMMSSIGAGYLNDTLAKVGKGDSSVTAVSVDQSMAGGLLGYCDALDESGIFSKWLHSQFSNSAVSFSHDTFKNLMSDGAIGDMASSMYAYCKYGQLLSMLGLDMAGESGSHPIRWLGGVIMRFAYTIAIFVPRFFVMLVGVLKVINPFRFFNSRSNLARIDGLDYYATATDGSTVALKSNGGGLESVASVLTTVYDFMYEHMALIILTIAFVILVTNLVFSANKNAFKKIKAYIMRLVVMFLVVPLCAMLYTETLNSLEDNLNVGLSYGTTRIVMSTFMDFEAWASMKSLATGGSSVADLKLNTSTNRPEGTTVLNLRTTCYNLNAQTWGARRAAELTDMGVPPFAYGGVSSFFPTQSLSTSATNSAAGDAVNDFNTSGGSSSLQNANVTEMVYDLLERYQDGTFYYSSSFESEFKAKNKSRVSEILETAEKSGRTVSEFRKNENDLIASGSSNVVWGGSAGGSSFSGDICTVSGNKYDFSNSIGLSPMSMYNYLSSSFDEANVKVYSNEKSSSGFIRDSHFSVNLIGTSALDQFLYYTNALALLLCVAVLGMGYALAVIFCNIKRSFLMFPEIITTTFGSLRAGARLVGHTMLLIVEVIVTVLVYMVAVEFLMAINDLICTDMVRGLTATSVGGALVMGASLSAVIVVSLILSTVMLVIFVIMALKVRKTIVKTIDEATTSLIDRLFGVQHIPEPDTPGLGGRAAGALAAGAGAGLANRMMNGDSSNQNARGTAVADDAGSDGGGGDGNGGGGNGGDGDGDGSEEATKVSEGEEAAAQADADGVEPADADSLGTDDMPSGTMSESEDSATSEDKQTAEELAESDSLDGAAVAGGAAVGAAVAGGDGGDGDDGDSGSGGSGTAPEAVKDNDSVDSNSDSESSESSETQKEVAGSADENDKSDGDGDESEGGDGDSDGDDKSDGGDKNQQTKNAQPGDSNTPKKNSQNGSKHKSADGKKTSKPGDKSGSDKKDGSGDKKDDQGGDSNSDNAKNAQPDDKADASDVKKAAAIGAATGTAAAAAANAKNAQEGDKAGGGSDDKSGGSGENSGGSGDKQGGSDDKSGGDSGTKPVVENADTNGGTDKSGGSGGESGGTAPANSNNGGGNAETAPNGESDGDTDKSGGDGDKSDGDGGDDKSNGGTRNAVPNADSNGAPTAPGSRAGTKQLGGTAAQVAAAQAAAAAAAAGTVTTAPNGSAAKPGENQNGGSGENSGGGAGEKQSGGSGENSGGASTRPVANAGGENQSGGSGEKQSSSSGEKQSGGSDDKKNGGNAGGANSNNSGGNGGNSGGGNAHTKPLETTGGSGSGSIEHGESHGSGPSDVERSEPIPKSPDPAAPSSGGNNANTTIVSGGSGGNNQQQSGGNSGPGQQGDGVRNARSAPSGQNQRSGGNQNQQQGGGTRTVRQSGGQNQQQGGNNGASGQGQNRAPSGNNQNQQQGGGTRTVRQSGGQNQQHGGSQGGGSGQRTQAQSGAQGGQSTVHQTQSENPAPRQQGGQSGQVAQGSPNGRRVSGSQPNSGRPSQSRVIGAAVVGSFLQSSNNKIVSEMGRGMSRAAEIEMYQNRGTQAQNRNQAQNQNRPGTNTTDTHSDTEKKELEDKATDVIRTNKKNQPPRKPPAKKKVLNINPGKVKDYSSSKKPGDKPDGDDADKRQRPEREDPKKRPETRPDTSGGAGSNGAPPPPPGGDDDDMLF